MANNVFCNKSLEVKIWPQKEKYVNHSVGNCLINYNGQGCDSCDSDNDHSDYPLDGWRQ